MLSQLRLGGGENPRGHVRDRRAAERHEAVPAHFPDWRAADLLPPASYRPAKLGVTPRIG